MFLTCTRPSRSRRLLVAVLAAATIVGLGLPAAAQTVPEASPTTPMTAKQQVLREQLAVDAAIGLAQSRADLSAVERSFADATARLAAAERARRETDARLTGARTRLVETRASLRSQAVIAYQHHSDRLGMVLSVDRVVSLAAGNHYANAVAAFDHGETARLEGLVAELEQRRDEQDEIHQRLADQQARLRGGRVDRQAAIDRQQAEIDRLGGVPVMGSSVLTGAELAAWFASTGRRAHLMDDTPIEDLAEMYVSEGAAERVRGDIAFAQAVVETGGFARAADNNFAGLGACDSCGGQYRFPSPRDGVRAQIQLLRNYADPLSRAGMLTNPLEVTLHGSDPQQAEQAFDTFSFKGRAPVWDVMGAGNWASDPRYAGKVLSLYSQMLAFKASLLT